MSRIKLTRNLLLFSLAGLLGVACGDDDGGGGMVDARPMVDAPMGMADAGVDAAPEVDAAVPTHSGVISVQDIKFLGTPLNGLGHGLAVLIDFAPLPDADHAPTTVVDDNPISPLGCEAYLWDKNDTDFKNFPLPGEDHGTVTIAGATGGNMTCVFNAAAKGYICPEAMGMDGGPITPGIGGDGNLAGFTDAAGAAFSAAHVGLYLSLPAAADPRNRGPFPIVGYSATPAPTAVVYNPYAQAEATYTGSYLVLEGAGPNPAYSEDENTTAPSDPLLNGDMVDVSLTPGGGMAFNFAAVNDINAGDAFALDANSETAMTSYTDLTDGNALTLTCTNCGAAPSVIVNITATDGNITNIGPSSIPEPVNKLVNIRCSELAGDGVVTIPDNLMQVLQNAAPTRIRISFSNVGVSLLNANTSGPPNTTNIVVGHGIVAVVNQP